MAVAVVSAIPIVDRGKPRNDAATELGVRRANSSINYVSCYPCTRCVVVVSSIKRKVALIDSIQTPGRACLRSRSGYQAVFFYEFNLGIFCHSGRLHFVHAYGKALDRPVKGMTTRAVTAKI